MLIHFPFRSVLFSSALRLQVKLTLLADKVGKIGVIVSAVTFVTLMIKLFVVRSESTCWSLNKVDLTMYSYKCGASGTVRGGSGRRGTGRGGAGR